MISKEIDVEQFFVRAVYDSTDVSRKRSPHHRFEFKGGVKFTGLFWLTGAALAEELGGELKVNSTIDTSYILVFIDGVTSKPVRLYKGEKIEVVNFQKPDNGRQLMVDVYAESAGVNYQAVIHSYEASNG